MNSFKKYLDNGATLFILRSPFLDYKILTLYILILNTIIGAIMQIEGYSIFDYPFNIINITTTVLVYIALLAIKTLFPKALDLFGYGDPDSKYYKIMKSIIKDEKDIDIIRNDIKTHLFNYKDLKYGLLMGIAIYGIYNYQLILGLNSYMFYGKYLIHFPFNIIVFILDQTYFGLIILHGSAAVYSAIYIMTMINKAIKKENLKIWHLNTLLKNEILYATSDKPNIEKLHETIEHMEPFHRFRENIEEITKIPLILTYAILGITITFSGVIVIYAILNNTKLQGTDYFALSILTLFALISLIISTKTIWKSMRNVKRSFLDIFELVYDELEQKYMLLMAMGRSQKVEETKAILNKDMEILNSMISEVKAYKTFPITTSTLLKIVTSSLIPIISIIIKTYMQ